MLAEADSRVRGWLAARERISQSHESNRMDKLTLIQNTVSEGRSRGWNFVIGFHTRRRLSHFNLRNALCVGTKQVNVVATL